VRHSRDWAKEDLRDSDAGTRDERTVAAEPEEALRRARVSWLAVIGLLLGTVGVLAALTGELAPIAVIAGVLGLLCSFGGLVATGKRYLASRPLALLAILANLGALTVAVMVYSGQFDWLNRDNQVGWLRDWLNARVPGMAYW
jgi:drug/metabolite transporter (DMT)-like permease